MSKIIVICMLLLCLPPMLIAQEEEQNKAVIAALNNSIAAQMSTNPADIKKRIEASLVSQREYLKVRVRAMSDPETAQLLARFSRVYYEALIKEGFSSDEAMSLVMSVGVPPLR